MPKPEWITVFEIQLIRYAQARIGMSAARQSGLAAGTVQSGYTHATH